MLMNSDDRGCGTARALDKTATGKARGTGHPSLPRERGGRRAPPRASMLCACARTLGPPGPTLRAAMDASSRAGQ